MEKSKSLFFPPEFVTPRVPSIRELGDGGFEKKKKKICAKTVGTRDRSIDRSSHNLLSLAFIKVCDELSRRWRCLRIYAGNIASFNLAGSLVRKDQMFAQRSKRFFFFFLLRCGGLVFVPFLFKFHATVYEEDRRKCVLGINEDGIKNVCSGDKRYFKYFVRNCELDRN